MNNVVTYACFADGGPNNSYQWIRLRDSVVVSVAQEITLDNTDPLDGGDYLCTITNIAGSDTALTTLNGEICMIVIINACPWLHLTPVLALFLLL